MNHRWNMLTPRLKVQKYMHWVGISGVSGNPTHLNENLVINYLYTNFLRYLRINKMCLLTRLWAFLHAKKFANFLNNCKDNIAFVSCKWQLLAFSGVVTFRYKLRLFLTRIAFHCNIKGIVKYIIFIIYFILDSFSLYLTIDRRRYR